MINEAQNADGSALLRPSCSANSKSCFNCKHLEWIEAEAWDPMGYVCNKRKYRSKYEENTHMSKMEDKKYLLRSKMCCEPKQQNVATGEVRRNVGQCLCKRCNGWGQWRYGPADWEMRTCPECEGTGKRSVSRRRVAERLPNPELIHEDKTNEKS